MRFLLPAIAAASLLAPPVRGHAQNVIDDVNNAMLNIIQNTSAALINGPPEVANEIAMVDSAMFDAVNAATGLTYAPLNYSGGAVAGANANAAALQAAVTVMTNLYVNPTTSLYKQFVGQTGSGFFSPTILAAHPGYAGAQVGPTTAQMLQVGKNVAAIQTELTALGGATAVTAGTALGTAAGAAAIAKNNISGSRAAMVATLTPYIPPGSGIVPGVYVPPLGRPALQPTWGGVTPMGLTTAQITAADNQFAPGPKPLGSNAYAMEVLQTECEGAGSALPASIASVCGQAGFGPGSAAKAQAALFWNDPGGTLQPPGHWLQIVDTVTSQQGLGLLQTARAAAGATVAMNDAGIAAWAVKYNDNTWRPITAIQDCSTNTAGGSVPWTSSANFNTCDTGWTSLIATPPHPDYIAGHPAFSGAAATALADAIGTDNVTFVSTSNAYCNGGTTALDAEGYIVSCTLNGVTYSMAGASCAGGGSLQTDLEGTVIGCALGGVLETVIGPGCNNAGLVTVLDPGGSGALNPLYNGSPLICPIAETFNSISQASGGDLGAEFSRVDGGIHTPDAVIDALAVGNEIGRLVSSEDLPEPPMLPTLAAGLLILAILRNRWRAARTAN